MNESAEPVCPLAAVDQRLADVHTIWHQAEAAYFDPTGFRLAIQNAIQTLRTVTFILQKHKSIIPNFASWYGDGQQPGKWQKRFNAEPLMCWMRDTRNKIEKQGDLEAHSVVRAEIIASYLEEGPCIEVPAHLFDGAEKLLKSVPDSLIREHIRKNGALRIQRRWVENTLPGYELLDAVAIAYGKIAELVHDAHRQIGLNPPYVIKASGETIDLRSTGWRIPCMIGHKQPRTLLFSLKDFSQTVFRSIIFEGPKTEAEIAAVLERYDGNPFGTLNRGFRDKEDLAAAYFSVARTVFLRDGYHQSFLFLFRDLQLLMVIGLNTEDVLSKYLIMREMAHKAITTGADTVILVGEAWSACASELRPYERPADSSVRTEVLFLNLVSKDGVALDFVADIVRDGQAFSLGNTQILKDSALFQLAPFYESWGCSLPVEWMTKANAALYDSKRP
jgi:hypothetical protein